MHEAEGTEVNKTFGLSHSKDQRPTNYHNWVANLGKHGSHERRVVKKKEVGGRW